MKKKLSILLSFLILAFFITSCMCSCNDSSENLSLSTSPLPPNDKDILLDFTKTCETLSALLHKGTISVTELKEKVEKEKQCIFNHIKRDTSIIPKVKMKKTNDLIEHIANNSEEEITEMMISMVYMSTEEQLELIRKNTTETFYILAQEVAYRGEISWNNEDIINDEEMTLDEKFILIETKLYLEVEYLETPEAIHSISNYKNMSNSHYGPKKPPTAEQVQKCKDDLAFNLGVCKGSYGVTRLATGIISLKNLPLGIVGLGLSYLLDIAKEQCENGARRTYSYCLNGR